MEDELRESESRFRNLVETTSDWIWEVDENAVYTYASPQIYHILGYRPEEVIGKTPFDFMSPEEAKRVAGIFGPTVSAKKPITNLENTNLHKDGHQVVLETSGVPVIGIDGKL
ncbi:MAG: PAS domain S-box protein, partial [Deltaproteobacteria bacterium]